MNRLPTELIDFVIDFHHSDKRTLEVCSLVCRDWLPASQFHRFGRVIVHHDNVHSFVELLASPSSTIASHVRTLYFIAFYVNKPLFDIITPFLEKFVSVRSITLEGGWDLISETNLSRAFGKVGNMELTRVSYCHYGWPTLTFTLGGHDPSSFSSTLRFLQSAIHDNQSSSWLPTVVQLPTVSQLDLFDIRERHMPTVQAVLKSGGQSIHTIKLEFGFGRPGLALISDYVDLSHYTNLRSLSISGLDLRNSEQTGHGSFLKIIQRISSTSFTHIEIKASVDRCEDMIQLDCEKLADELNNHSRFPELQKVRIRIWSSGTDEAAALVHREMSCLADRGILQVKNILPKYR